MAQFLDDWRDRWYDVVDWYYAMSGRRKAVAVAVVVALLVGIGFWQIRPDSESAESGFGARDSADIPAPISASDGVAGGDSSDDDPVVTTGDGLGRVSDVDTTISTSAVPSSSPSAGESTVPPADGPGATTASASTSVPAESSGPGETPLDYPSSPDGSPLPLVVVFDTETITISGQVPSQAAKDRLVALAKANSQFPDAEVIDNMVVNPAVPISVGARVIELNSARFPEGTADILPDHARELDRVVNVMNALPNISVLVIGHADQRGDDLTNFAISDERARAVVNYLIYLGIAPARLSSRAAGEADLLALGDDDASLALNRRTEFIFGGLLIE